MNISPLLAFFLIATPIFGQTFSSGNGGSDDAKPSGGFDILRRVEKFDDFLLREQHPYLEQYSWAQRQEEQLAFQDDLEAHPENEGVLFQYMKAAEELGVFEILHEANLCPCKEIPIIRKDGGFLSEYCMDALRMLVVAKICNYTVKYDFETGEFDKALRLLDDLVNAEIIVTTHGRTWQIMEKLSSDPRLPAKYRKRLQQLKDAFQEAKAIHRAQLEAK